MLIKHILVQKGQSLALFHVQVMILGEFLRKGYLAKIDTYVVSMHIYKSPWCPDIPTDLTTKDPLKLMSCIFGPLSVSTYWCIYKIRGRFVFSSIIYTHTVRHQNKRAMMGLFRLYTRFYKKRSPRVKQLNAHVIAFTQKQKIKANYIKFVNNSLKC